MSEDKKLTVLVNTETGLALIEEPTNFNDLKLTLQEKRSLFFSRNNPTSTNRKKPFFFWNPPGRSSYEKKLVRKIDCLVLTYVCLSFFAKYLDQSNISNAYVSGMREALHMEGNMYNWLGQAFFISYAICGLFGTLLITRFPAYIILPLFEIIWAIMCLLNITCDTYTKILILRVIQGGFSGLAYPAANYILGSWYTEEELNVRTGIFVAAGSAGGMFGGYIQSGIQAHMDGKSGLPGWKWIFVIDFLITLPIAAFGYFLLPGDPNKPRKSLFLTDEDFEYCRKRMQVVENVDKVNKFDITIIKRLFTSWQFYTFTTGYVVSQLVEEGTNYWGIVLELQGYNVYDRNNIPTIQPAVKIVSSIIAGLYMDVRGKKWEMYLIICAFWISGLSISLKYDVAKSAQFYGYSILGVCAAFSVIIVSWANDMCREDDQLRAGVLGSFNMVFMAVDIPYATTVWNTEKGPRFHEGYSFSLGLCSFLVIFLGLILLFDRYQNRVRDYYDDLVHSRVPVTLTNDKESTFT